MIKRIIITSVLAVLLSSCSTYRNFVSPSSDVKNLYGDSVQIVDTLVEMPSWREYFKDPSLQALIQKALESNSDLQIVCMKIEQTEAALKASKLAYIPSLGFSGQGSVSTFDGYTNKTYNLPLTTQWEIDISGKLKNKKEQSLARVLQSKEYSKMVQTQLISSLVNNYYTLIMLDEQLRVTHESIINLKKNLNVMIELKKAGMQTEAAVNQATANYYNVMTTTKDLEKQIKNIENNISLLINETPKRIQRSSFSESYSLNYKIEDKISLITLANRPDVKIAEYQLRTDFYGVNVARSAFYPSLTLGGSIGWTNSVGAIIDPATFLLSAIGSLTQPIFAKGANRANLTIAKSEYEQSLLSFEKSLLIAGSEVNNALTEYQTSSEKLELRVFQIDANKKAVINSTFLMKHSSMSYLEVLIAQNTLLQSELFQVADWFENIRSKINLYKALGGGIN